MEVGEGWVPVIPAGHHLVTIVMKGKTNQNQIPSLRNVLCTVIVIPMITDDNFQCACTGSYN